MAEEKLILPGIHHISAITGDASHNVAFYTQVLGLRLTKKTVNQDDVSVYHLFYGDEFGSPGTDLTFFEIPSSTPHKPGAGQISSINFGVKSEDAVRWWHERLQRYNLNVEPLERWGEPGPLAFFFQDPEGQQLAIVDAQGKMSSHYWPRNPISEEYAIQGFHSVRLTYQELEPTGQFLDRVLHFRRGRAYTSSKGFEVAVYETGEGGPGAEVHIELQPDARWRRFVGIGGVHHVAFRVPNVDEHRAWQQRLNQIYPHATPVIDRYYFAALYFREPAGVLFELSTDGPGFTVDESADALGERLSLPPFFEDQRAVIEQHLHPIEPITFEPKA